MGEYYISLLRAMREARRGEERRGAARSGEERRVAASLASLRRSSPLLASHNASQ
jgi:hypothetical protein